ncbi:hypothetical protein D3C81_1879600 [compost metagenome]
MLAFAALDEAAQTLVLAQGIEVLLAPGEDLVHVRLVSDVEYDLVLRGLVIIMQGQGQFHNAQIGRQMSSRQREFFDQKPPYLSR